MSMFINLEQHFRSEEMLFIQKVSDWIQKANNNYQGILTKFLNPREQYIVSTLVNHHGTVKVAFNGGTTQAESKRALIYPEYFEPTVDDFQIELLEIIYPDKFSELHHSTILGSLIHNGIDRAFFGDILRDEHKHWQIFLDKKLANYVIQNVVKIGNVRVSFENKNFSETLQSTDDWDEQFELLSSLRVDSVISAVYNLSRKESKTLIEQQQVKINWATEVRANFVLSTEDIVSVRKYGRFKIEKVEGKSKKDKIKVILKVIQR